MKKGVLIILSFCLLLCQTHAQSCLAEGITLSTQAQIGNFLAEYPGCTEIEGDVVLNYNITDLQGLNGLTRINGDLIISECAGLVDLTGLNNLTFIGGDLYVHHNNSLISLAGLNNLDTLVGSLILGENNYDLASMGGMNQLKAIGGDFIIQEWRGENLEGLDQLMTIGGDFLLTNTSVPTFSGFNNLQFIGGSIEIANNWDLRSITGLESLDSIGQNLIVSFHDSLTTFSAFPNLRHIGGCCSIHSNPLLLEINSFDNLKSIGSFLLIGYLGLADLQSFSALETIGGGLYIDHNSELSNLDGLENLTAIKQDSFDYGLFIGYNTLLENLNGLRNVSEFEGNLTVISNPMLTSLDGLNFSGPVQALYISENQNLSSCAVLPVCIVLNQSEEGYIDANASGCNSTAEVMEECNGQPVMVTVLMDMDGDCQPDAISTPAQGVQVLFSSTEYAITKQTNPAGVVSFGNFGTSGFALSLPQFPTIGWASCESMTWVEPAATEDTIFVTLLLRPLVDCPDLFVNLELPPAFRGCPTISTLQVYAGNLGTTPAENIEVGVVLPLSVMDVIDSSLPVVAQSADTLFFSLDNMVPFETMGLSLNVRIKCDTFLLGQTLCLEAFGTISNACLPTGNFSEVRLYSQCIDEDTVRFTLRNIGNAPTQAPHEYVIIEDEIVLMTEDFTLEPNEERTVDLPANGATYRMEATRFDDGTLTALSLENCGGLTPGLVTAYWLDEGLNNSDFDCREVIGAYDPNQKTAIPKGVGDAHLLVANRPLQYTIEFQNTGTDTAFRVLLTDILSPHLDVNTFRPGFSSHHYTWEIRGIDTLNVLFFPIQLPDSNVNVEGSKGFFTFDIAQKPDLPDGTVIENTASIVFDYNPPIVTNTTFHTIGELVVNIDEPAQENQPRWQVFANPVKTSATFRAIGHIPGEKRFELYDQQGKCVRTAYFEGQEFVLHRHSLAKGVYFFRIFSGQETSAAGKIIIAE